MKYIILYLCFILNLGIGYCNICSEKTFKYQIEESFTILDIRGDDISALPTECYKQVNIPGNVEATLSVETARLSGDIYWTYSSEIGMTKKVFYDDAFVYFGKCSVKNLPSINIRSGLQKNFNSSHVCLVFQPDIDFRHLGGHIAGGSIKISVRVKTAHCNVVANTRRDSDGVTACHSLCSTHGVVRHCPGDLDQRQSTEQTTKTKQNLDSTRSTVISARTTDTTIPVTYPVLTTKSQGPSTQVQSAHVPGHIQMTSVTTPNKLSPSISTRSVSSLGSSSTMYLNNETTKSSKSHNEPQIVTSSLKSSSLRTSIMITNTTRKDHINHNIRTTSSFLPYSLHTSPYSSYHNDKADFGLVQGIFVFGGCLLVILIVVIVACCLASKKKKCFRPNSDTLTSSERSYSKSLPRCKDLLWRDNWLVRYHTNPAFNQSESDIECLPEKCLNQPSPETVQQSGHTVDHYDSCKNDDEDPYDNPWPLVRLDSDFVRNTKNIQLNQVHQKSETKNDSESLYTENSTRDNKNENIKTKCTDPTSRKGLDDDLGKLMDSNCLEASMSGTENTERLHYKKKGTGYVTKGSYNILRIKRSSLKSDRSSTSSDRKVYDVVSDALNRDLTNAKQTNIEIKQCCTTVGGGDNMGLTEEPDISSQQRCSSLCSDCSANFGALLQQEIDKLEAGLGLDANVSLGEHDVPSDRRLGDTAATVSGMSGEWRVNTLYALVSQRGAATQPCGTAGTLQFPK